MTNPYIKKTEEKVVVTTQNDNENIENKNTNNANNTQNTGFLNSLLPNGFNSTSFLQGAVIGALGAYLLTNEKAQQAVFKSVVKLGKFIQAGSEELKERFEDAKAELEANEL